MENKEAVSAFAAYGLKKKTKKPAKKPKGQKQQPAKQQPQNKKSPKRKPLGKNDVNESQPTKGKRKPPVKRSKSTSKEQALKIAKKEDSTSTIQNTPFHSTPVTSQPVGKKRKRLPVEDVESPPAISKRGHQKTEVEQNGKSTMEPKSKKPKSYSSRKDLKNVEQNGKIDVEVGENATENSSPKQVPAQQSSLGESAKSVPDDPPTSDSIEDGREVFRWLISPIDFDDFFQKFWEKKPCLIQRNDSSYFAKLISCAAIDQMLLDNHVEFTKNIDVTSYVNGLRETLNPEGRAMPSVIWNHYEDGCSIRLLNPQTFLQPVYVMNATLQDFFHCMVGTNAYLTPPNSQGFAPHYDDIEAFVLQIEGQKRWKLYNPRTTDEVLARFSSQNFTQDEIGEPILDKVLKPGDVLYFPRGTIHQACTQPGHHSLHVTLSMYQKHSYADLFEILLPKMLSRAIEKEVDLRRGLPLNIWQNLGKIFMGNEEYTDERDEILGKCERLMQKVLRHANLDEAVDLMAKRFQHDALPPALTAVEKVRTIFGAKTIIDKSGRVQYGYDITLDTHVRLIRANVLRVVEEEEAIRIYYYVDNSKEYHEYEPNFIEIEAESLVIVQQLVKEYPDYICTSELEAEGDDIKLSVVQGLYERGLLMVDEPMK